VVERMISSGLRRPLDSMRCEAKMVLIRVDLPSPVWPIVRHETRQSRSRAAVEQTVASRITYRRR
jgi:hypothetical protein